MPWGKTGVAAQGKGWEERQTKWGQGKWWSGQALVGGTDGKGIGTRGQAWSGVTPRGTGNNGGQAPERDKWQG